MQKRTGNPVNRRLDANMFKRGDVIVAQDDGSPWGRRDLDSPGIRIIRIPDMPKAEASTFLQVEPQPADRTLYNKFFQPRHVKIDLDALSARILAAIDAPRTEGVIEIPGLRWAQISAAKVIKTKIEAL